MSSIFDVSCSIFKDVRDRRGEYYDYNTHSYLRSMSLSDFLFGGYWQDEVERYRAKLMEVASEKGLEAAKKDPVVRELKIGLPSATLSGYFEQGRRTDLLTSYTGFIALDIDFQDNKQQDLDEIKLCLKDRPETAAIIKSCSGLGYFVMVRLAYPERHGEHFDALRKEYSRLGITLDKACRDITRLRIASFDMEPYINENAIPYTGLPAAIQQGMLEQRHYQNAARTNISSVYDKDFTTDCIEMLVKNIESRQLDIAPGYEDWFQMGLALARFDAELGKDWFNRLSKYYKNYDERQCLRQYDACVRFRNAPGKVTIEKFFGLCNKAGVELTKEQRAELYRKKHT